MGWVSDFFRLAWGFLYWNTRKTVFRLRGARNPCPCQHASDSGRAWETACDAVVHWHRPIRFRRLCPLLQQNRAGDWRCSVNREQVRPFWGRALAFYGVAGLILYLALTVTAFAFLRQVGYRVTYAGVAWPPAWERFTAIRTEFFLNEYKNAADAGDMQTALMALSTAYNLQPQNYPVGRQLAQLCQVGQPGLSDQIYRRLLNEHPAEAETTAQTWFRALLARGDFSKIEHLSAERILAVPDDAAAWINAFFFANERTANQQIRAQLNAAPALPANARFLLSLADDLARSKGSDQIRERLLKAAAEAPDSLTFFNVARQLTARGFARETLHWLERRSGLIGSRDLVPLRLDALAVAGWSAMRHTDVENLLHGGTHPVIISLLSAHLIRHPDATVRELVFSQLERNPLPPTPASYAAHLALFCAAGAGGDVPRLHWVAARIKAFLGDEFRGLDAVGAALLDDNANRRIENYLPVLQPLPLEVSYALFEHYHPVNR